MSKKKIDSTDILLETITEGIQEVKGVEISILNLKEIETAVVSIIPTFKVHPRGLPEA